MPVAFVSHGSPLVAIETGRYQEALERFGREHRPRAVVVISAHWDSGDTVRITSAAKHHLIYDFGGFPGELYELTYGAAGDPKLAQRIAGVLQDASVPSALDPARGLDHGVWVPLRLIYPSAAVPVVELSIPGTRSPAELFRIGELPSPQTSISIRFSWCSARPASRAGSSVFTKVFSTALYRCAASLSHESTFDKENVHVSQVVGDL
jgi:4,5-DOPA dioxygenase extradiol